MQARCTVRMLRRHFATIPAHAAAALEPGASLPAFHYQPPPYRGPSKHDVMNMRQDYLSPGETSRGRVQLSMPSRVGQELRGALDQVDDRAAVSTRYMITYGAAQRDIGSSLCVDFIAKQRPAQSAVRGVQHSSITSKSQS